MLLERLPVGHHLAVPEDRGRRIDVEPATSGFTSGGGGLPIGMLRFTECSWMGSVMMSPHEEHEHHVDQRRRVSLHHDVGLRARLAK